MSKVGPKELNSQALRDLAAKRLATQRSKTATQPKKPSLERITAADLETGGEKVLATLAARRAARNVKQAELMRARRAADKVAKKKMARGAK
jgi:hypothetical protein